MGKVAGLASGRRSKWFVLAAWIVLLFAIAPLGSKLGDVTNNQTQSFLPKGAESTTVNELLDKEFPGGETQSGLVLYERGGGLTAADKRKIATDARNIQVSRDVEHVGPVVPPLGRAARLTTSRDGSVAFTSFSVPDDNDKAAGWGKAVSRIVGNGSDGLHVFLTGQVGFSTDAEEVFGSLDTKLLLATVILVLVLLGAIYRSPLVAITPLIVVGVSYGIAQGFIYLYAKTGATVSSNGTTILVVLMFGVGTDYCLLLVSRYREELRRIPDKHDAMKRTLQRIGPALVASGVTVTLAMLVLLVADTGNIRSLGPTAAIGVFLVMLAGVTLLPALLTIFGRRGFWPRRKVVEYDPRAVAETHKGIWRRFGERVLAHPAAALGITLVIFAGGAVGLTAYKVDYSTTSFFKKKVEAVEGFKVIEKSFPAGTLAPTTVLVKRQSGPVTPADMKAAAARLSTVEDVAAVIPAGFSTNRRLGQLSVVLKTDPYKSAALNVVPKMRDATKHALPGIDVLVGGGSAINYDLNQSVERDTKLIVPLALLAILIILAILLEAILAPVVVILATIASFFGTLGLSILFLRYVVGDEGFDPSIPTFAFIFLVALGVDYSIFLMSRVREESRRFGTREGTLRALGATGPVITSAGIILAGTFSVLMTLPVTFTFDLGFMVAVGILLDTFVVRTIMLPAAIELIGDKVWWPSTPRGGGHLLGDEARDEPEPEREPVASG